MATVLTATPNPVPQGTITTFDGTATKVLVTMPEFKPSQTPGHGDISFDNTKSYDLILESGLDTTFFLSVYTEARASNDDILPTENGDKRGWWGDEILGIQTGSKAWLFSERGKLTTFDIESIRTEMINAVESQMVNTGLIDSIDISHTRTSNGVNWNVAMYRDTSTNVFLQYNQLWDGQIEKLTKEEL